MSVTSSSSQSMVQATTLWQHDYTLALENTSRLIGVDEAGRGALAGPVVAAAVCLAKDFFESQEAQAESLAINDSKQLKEADRETQHAIITDWISKGLVKGQWALANTCEIEARNILGATRLAMQRALEQLKVPLPSPTDDLPIFNSAGQCRILVDGKPLKPFPYAHYAIVKGDGSSLCIAAASILAKVERDRLMRELCSQHPDYGFSKHKGYGTQSHREALIKHGPCPQHRKLFLRKVLA